MLRIGLEGLVVETASCPPAHGLMRAREPGHYDRKHPDKPAGGFRAFHALILVLAIPCRVCLFCEERPVRVATRTGRRRPDRLIRSLVGCGSARSPLALRRTRMVA